MDRDDDLRGLDPDLARRFARDRDRWEQTVADTRARFRADTLVGVDVATARAAVEAAGGEFVTDDEPITMKLDPNRLVATVVDGRVTETRIG